MQRIPHREHAWLPYWPVVHGLAGGAGIGWAQGIRPDEHVALLERMGVTAILSLTPEPQVPSNGWARRLHPLPGMMPPRDVAEMEGLVAWVEGHRAAGGHVLVHCLAGKGRTGTVLAGWLMRHQGLDATQAINHLRRRQPAAVESAEQERFLDDYEAWLRARGLHGPGRPGGLHAPGGSGGPGAAGGAGGIRGGQGTRHPPAGPTG